VIRPILVFRSNADIVASYELQPLQAGVAILADNDVVVHGDAERARHVDDLLRYLDVGA
jgi:hypothetical protein